MHIQTHILTSLDHSIASFWQSTCITKRCHSFPSHYL